MRCREALKGRNNREANDGLIIIFRYCAFSGLAGFFLLGSRRNAPGY
jgi:hypothetical protein